MDHHHAPRLGPVAIRRGTQRDRIGGLRSPSMNLVRGIDLIIPSPAGAALRGSMCEKLRHGFLLADNEFSYDVAADMLAEHSRLGLLQAVFSTDWEPTPQRQFQLSSSTFLLVRLPKSGLYKR